VFLGINVIGEVSIGELIVISVTIAGFLITLIITFIKWKREKTRKSKLINFPTQEWKAYRRINTNILELQIYANVYLPYHSFACSVVTEVEGQLINMNYKTETTPFVRERCLVHGQVELDSLLQQAESLTISMVIQLDGDFKKESDRVTINIIDT
jgi:hypothetical protein